MISIFHSYCHFSLFPNQHPVSSYTFYIRLAAPYVSSSEIPSDLHRLLKRVNRLNAAVEEDCQQTLRGQTLSALLTYHRGHDSSFSKWTAWAWSISDENSTEAIVFCFETNWKNLKVYNDWKYGLSHQGTVAFYGISINWIQKHCGVRARTSKIDGDLPH